MSKANVKELPFPYGMHTLIRASAGAGKTHALSSQFIALLYQQAQPSSILATTFTRKAAGEILGKVLLRLAKATHSDKAAAELGGFFNVQTLRPDDARAILASLCKELHRVNVSTLDAFFSRLAGSFRLELDLPLDPVMVASTDPQAVRARALGIEALLETNEPDVMVEMLRRVHHNQTNRSVTAAIDQIVSQLHELYRMAPDKRVWSQLDTPDTLSQDNLTYVIEQLEHFLQGDLSKRYRSTLEKSLEDAQANDWEGFLSRGIPAKLAKGDLTFYKKPIEQDVLQVITPLFTHAKADRIARVAHQTLATWELLHEFDQHDQTIRKRQRLMTFSDLPLKLARELAPTSDPDALGLDAIYYRLDGQVQHLLLDEFQDTSPLQWQVLLPIAQEIVNHEGQGRSFFCVGDVKQSIYSWRGGCAELFDKLKTDLMLPDDAEEKLDTSYRSSQIVLDAVNQVFDKLPICPPVLDSKSQAAAEVANGLKKIFTNHVANFDLPGYVKLLTSGRTEDDLLDNVSNHELEQADFEDLENMLDAQLDGELDAAPPDAHAQFVAKYISGLVSDHPQRHVGVLVRTNKIVSQLIHLLQKAGVNASGEGGNPVTDDPAVELVLAALQLADHPGDSVARYHVARSPLAKHIQLVDLTPQGLEDFSHQLRDELSKHGYAAVLSQWTGLLAAYGNVRSATRLSQLVQLAQTYDLQSTTRPSEFVDFVKATPVEEPVAARVRVMTIHKAKGLEFDIVVLPELHSKIGMTQRQLSMVFRHHPTEEPAAIYRYAKETTRNLSPKLEEAYAQEEQRRLSDDLCALYVALTRAKQAMHMILPPLKLNDSGSIAAAGSTDLSPASILRSTLNPDGQEEPALAQTLRTLGDPNWDTQASTPVSSFDAAKKIQPTPVLLKLDLPTAGDPSRSWRVIAPSNLEADQSVRVDDLLRLVAADGRAYGSLVHAMFQQVQWLDAPLPESDIKQIIQNARRQVPEAAADQVTSASSEFTRMVSEPAIVDALRQPVAKEGWVRVDLWRERPFAVRIDGALVNGILDRVMIYRNALGQPTSATLIDYKTDRLPEADSHAQSIALLVARYRPQLVAYRKALVSMLKLPPEAISAQLLLLGPAQLASVV